MVASFRMELEHLSCREVPWSAILFGTAWTNVPSLRTFLEILLGNDSKYDSNDIDHYTSPCM